MRLCLICFLFLFSMFSHAIIESQVTETYENGEPKREATFHHQDKLQEEIYRNDGSLMIRKDYMWVSFPYGVWERFDQNENLVDEGSFFIRHGSPEYEDSFILNKKDGPYIEKYENGTTKLAVTFEDGTIQGKLEMYYEDGTLQYESQVKDGTTPEYIRDYFKSGVMRVNIFGNGHIDYINIFNEEGLLVSQRVSKSGPYLVRDYREDGRIKREILYKEGFSEFRSRSYNEEGFCRPKSETAFKADLVVQEPVLTELGKNETYKCIVHFMFLTDANGMPIEVDKGHVMGNVKVHDFLDLGPFVESIKSWKLISNHRYTVILSVLSEKLPEMSVFIQDREGFDMRIRLNSASFR